MVSNPALDDDDDDDDDDKQDSYAMFSQLINIETSLSKKNS